jgi:16S rRNA (guanine966-N2)-methyltransferase
VRIIAGKAGRMQLAVPKGRIRPMTDRLRTSLFGAIEPRLPGAAVLDLFAGTGSLGLEALSRGAARAVFIEKDRVHAHALRKNVETYLARDPVPDTDIRIAGVLPYLDYAARHAFRFDVIFVDPPFGTRLLGETLPRIAEGRITAPGGIVVCQHEAGVKIDAAGFSVFRETRSGNNVLVLLEFNRSSSP